MTEAVTHDHDGEHPNLLGTYVTVFLVLGFLTVIEVFIPRVYSGPWDGHLKMILLCVLAFAKAILVAAFFMHLKWEHPWLRRIAAMPLYMGILVIVIMLESIYR